MKNEDLVLSPEISGAGFHRGYRNFLHSAFPLTAMLYHQDGIGQVMSSAWIPLDIMLGNEARHFSIGFIRPENHVSHSLKVLSCRCFFMQSPSWLSRLLLRGGFCLATLS